MDNTKSLSPQKPGSSNVPYFQLRLSCFPPFVKGGRGMVRKMELAIPNLFPFQSPEVVLYPVSNYVYLGFPPLQKGEHE